MAAPEPAFLRLEPGLRDRDPGDPRRGRLRWSAVIVAAIVHALAIVAFLIELPFSFVPDLSQPPPIAVSLVMEPPAPPPEAKPAPEQPKVIYDRRSGNDQDTTAPKPAEEKGPEAAPKPAPEPVPETAQAGIPTKPKPIQPTAPQTSRAQEAARETAVQPARRIALNVKLGDREQNGDPYLNRLNALVERQRFYPREAVAIKGTIVMNIGIAPTGRLEYVRVMRSTGSSLLDDTAKKMIALAAPFPPVPDYFGHDILDLTVTAEIFPPRP